MSIVNYRRNLSTGDIRYIKGLINRKVCACLSENSGGGSGVSSVSNLIAPGYIIVSADKGKLFNIKGNADIGLEIPDASLNQNLSFYLKNSSTVNQTITSAGGNIEGSASLILEFTPIKESVQLVSDGTDWLIVG